MEQNLALNNRVRVLRSSLGLSQQDLARLAGVSRQTIGGIETGQYAPSALVGLRIARALKSSVEDVFWLDDSEVVSARIAGNAHQNLPARAIMARVGQEWVAHPLGLVQANETTHIPADGSIESIDGNRALVRLLERESVLSNTVLVAGCAPALDVWSRTAERWKSDLRAPVLHTNSTNGLSMLTRGEVHVACVHFSVPQTTAEKSWSTRDYLGGRIGGVVNMGRWTEGLMVAQGNPKAIHSFSDIGQAGITFVNRELGAASRQWFDVLLNDKGIPHSAINGYEIELHSPNAVASAIAMGRADVGIGVESAALMHGVGFVPICSVQYDLVYLDEYASDQTRRLLETLSSRRVRSQFQSLGATELEACGDVVGVN